MDEAPSPSALLSLSEASALLGVHNSTLRRWADSGALPVIITPGGHRRFARTDIERLIARKALPLQVLANDWAERALQQTRSDLLAETPPAWLARLEDNQRNAQRRVGQRLMGVVLRFVAAQGDQAALLEEARHIGHDYAAWARRQGLGLTSAIEATLFFRDALVEAAMDLPEQAHVQPEASARLLRRINLVLNAVQLAIAAGYERDSQSYDS